MVRYLFLICFVVAGWLGNACAMDAIRPKLACFPLSAKSIEAMAYNENISALLVNALNRSGVVELIERKKIEAVIEQHGLRLDALDQGVAKTLAAQVGYNYVLTGTVGRSDGKLVLDLNLIGTNTVKDNHHWNYKIGDGEISLKLDEITAAIVPIMRDFEKAEAPQAPVKTPTVAAPPKELRASGTARSIRLRWSPSSAESVAGYRIFRSTTRDGAYSQIGNSPVNSYSDDNLELNDSFFYKVKALGRGGEESDFSSTIQGATTVVPQPPVFMNVEQGLRSAVLSWYQRPVTGSDPQLVPVGYRVYRSLPDGSDLKQVAQVNSEATAYTDSSLSEGATFRYHLTSVNASGGESEQSATLEVTTPGGMGAVTAVSGKLRKIPLSWKQHASPGITGYHVYRSLTKDGPFEKIANTAGKDSTSYLDAVDSDKALRWYRIAGVDRDGGETMPSEAVSATTRDIPAAPGGLQAKSGQPRRVTLSWQAVPDPEDGKGGYRIYRSEEEQGKYQRIGQVDEMATAYEDSVTPLNDNAAYWYRLAAVNAAGAEGFASNPVKGVTKARPAAPQGLAAKPGEVKRVSLDWQDNKEGDLKEYRIWVGIGGGKFTPVAVSSSPHHVETGLSDGTLYAYAVTAIDKDGLESELSSSVQAATKPAPSRAAGTRPINRAGQAGIAWVRNPESDVKNYCVYRKGFLGAQKLCETRETEYLYTGKDKADLYVTAVNTDGLESEPSATVTIDASK